MKFLWKQQDSGLIEALVTGYESERFLVEMDEFSRKVTMELPPASYIATMLTINHAQELFMLKLMGSPGLHVMVLAWMGLKCTLPTSHVRHVPYWSSTLASEEWSMNWITGFVTEWTYSTKH